MIENKDLDQFILQYSGYSNTIYDNTSISRDLNIKSEAAFDFIQAYSEQFNIDISSFDFVKYFPSSDSQNLLSNTRTDLTVGDLIRGIRAGELNDDIIAFEENDPNLPPKLTIKKIILGAILVLIVAAILTVIAIWV